MLSRWSDTQNSAGYWHLFRQCFVNFGYFSIFSNELGDIYSHMEFMGIWVSFGRSLKFCNYLWSVFEISSWVNYLLFLLFLLLTALSFLCLSFSLFFPFLFFLLLCDLFFLLPSLYLILAQFLISAFSIIATLNWDFTSSSLLLLGLFDWGFSWFFLVFSDGSCSCFLHFLLFWIHYYVKIYEFKYNQQLIKNNCKRNSFSY